MSEYDKLHKFFWAGYGSKGLDLCAGTIKLWANRVLGVELSDADGLKKVIDDMVAEKRIVVRGSRTEVMNPYDTNVDWGGYVDSVIALYEAQNGVK